MAIPRGPNPPRGHGTLNQIAERRGREIKKLRAEIAALHERIAELEAEHEADTQAVAEACAGVVDGTASQPYRHEYAVRRLHARFADRIGALSEATDGSGEPPACPDCDHWAASHYTGTETKTGCALCSCRRSVFEIQQKD